MCNKSQLSACRIICALSLCVMYFATAYSQSSITQYSRTTFSRTYSSISGTFGPSGDDNALNIILPFAFRYDGNDYDQARICTNGWVELGSAAHPLSFTNSNFNVSLFTSDLPNKTLAPWWDDLGTGSGSIHYTTIGSAPNRIFAVEWQNVLSYYIGGRTINFQLRLYETSEVIEFWYGSASGTSNPNESASFGIEDSIGGPGHFIDGPTGSFTTGTTALNTTSNWPSVFYRFSPQPIQILRPNGGEYFYVGLTDTIKWAASGVTSVKLEYSTDVGSTWSVVAASTPALTGTYAWAIPNTPTRQALVRASDASNVNSFDLSDSVFTIQQPPSITVTPDSFAVSLGESDSTTRTMTIGNVGTGDLTFEISIGKVITKTISSLIQRSKILEGPRTLTLPTGTKGTGTITFTQPSQVAQTKYNYSANSVLNVAVLGAPSQSSWNNEVQSKLLATGYFSSVSVINIAMVTPTLTELQAFNAVLVYSDASYNNSTLLGDVLADYVDAGGGVVGATFATASVPLSGRFNTDNYWAITPSGQTQGTRQFLGTIYVPDHPILQGVTSFDGGSSSYRQTSTSIASGATRIADWTDGVALVATKVINGVNRADLGFFPPSSDSRSDFWNASTDGALLMANALRWVSGASDWLSVSPMNGTVAPSASQDVTVKLNAANLVAGDYRASIVITNNDQQNNPQTVPVHLHVIGKPVIVVNPDSIDFGSVFVSYPKTDTLRVQNTGSDVLTVSNITSTNTVFTVNLTSFAVPAHSEQLLLVSFAPTDTVRYDGILTITSNDSAHLTLNVPLNGQGAFAPNITVTPDSFAVSIGEGDSTTRTMTIGNVGMGSLDFKIRNQLGGFSASIVNDKISRTSDASKLMKSTTRDSSIRILTIGFGSSPILDSLGFRYVELFPSQFDTVHLSNYDLLYVGATGDYTVLQSLYNRRTDIASFVQAGGGLVVLSESDWRWVPATISSISQSGDRVHITASTHPILTSLTDSLLSYWGNSYHYTFTSYDSYLQPLAIALDGSNRPIILAGELGDGRVVLDGQDPDYHFRYNGDPKTILVGNMIRWVGRGGVKWLSENPDSGNVAPGSSQDILVTFNAIKLRGGDYRAEMVLENNDPQHNPKSVPVHLHVIGQPNIDVAPDSLDFGSAFVGFRKIDTIKVQNTGSVALDVSSITSNNPIFLANLTFKIIPPHGEQAMLVRFTPSDTGVFTGLLTITSNDGDHPTLDIPLRGRGTFPPSITVVPDSFVVSVDEGDSTTRTMTIGNVGMGSLDFKIRNQLGGFSASIVNDKISRTSDASKLMKSTTGNSSMRILTIDLGTVYYRILDFLGLQYVKVFPSQFDTVNLFNYDVLYVGYTEGGSFSALQSLYNRRADIATFVQAGGGLVALANVGSTGYEWQWIPATVSFSYGEGNNVRITVPSHPVMASLTDSLLSYWDYSYHNRFTSYDSYLQPLSIALDGGNQPVTIAGELGGGRVVLCGQDPDYHFVTRMDPKATLVNNMIQWVGRGGGNWISERPDSGTVAPGSSQDILVTFNAIKLRGGDYRAGMVLESNDPQHNLKQVPVHLHVIGQPNIVVAPDSIDFGNAFIGFGKTDTLTVKNTGSDVLTVSNISSDNTVFSINQTSFTITAHSEGLVLVSFVPTDTSRYAGMLTITSNDGDHPTLDIPLSGRGVFPPSITVTPDSFVVSVGEGDSTTRTMTIGNVGKGPLAFSIANLYASSGIPARNQHPQVMFEALSSVTHSASHAQVYSDSKGRNLSNIAIDVTTNNPIQSAVHKTLRPISKAVVGSRVLWDVTHGVYSGYQPSGYYSSLASVLDSIGFTVNTTDVGVKNLDLTQYNVVVINVGSAWFSDYTQAEVAALVHYVQNGGSVVVMGDNSNPAVPNININPVAQAFGSTCGGPNSLFNITNLSSHPIFKDVSQIYFGYGGDLTVSSPSKTVALDINGYNAIAIAETGLGKVVVIGDINVWDDNGMTYADNRLFAKNTFAWLALPVYTWLSENPASGMVSPSSTQDVTLKLNVKNFPVGDYRATIVITNNDLQHNPKTVPVHLHVIGKPHIVVVPDSIDFGNVFTGFEKTNTLTVKNTGSDVLTVSDISSDNTVFSINQTSFTIAAHSEGLVLVSFVPTDTSRYAGMLTITSNDEDQPTMTVSLKGQGVYAPSITVNPDSFAVSVGEGDSTTRTMTIGNVGLGNLTFEIQNYQGVLSLNHSSTTQTAEKITLPIPTLQDIHPRMDFHSSSYSQGRIAISSNLHRQHASSGNVLVIGDGGSENDVTAILEAAGFTSTIVSDDSIYNGTNPSPFGFDAIILLDGISYNDNMPLAGQDALVTYVSGGGGLLFTEWIASEYSEGRYTHFGSIISVPRSYGRQGTETDTVIQAHPITAGLQTVFPVTSGSNIGRAIAGTVLIRGSESGDAVVASTFGSGAVVQYAVAANYGGYRPFIDANMQALLVNTINWLSGGAKNWLSVNPSRGTVIPSATQDVTLKFNAQNLSGGDYRTNIIITNNDPAHNPKTVPVHLHVVSRPHITVVPDSIDFGLGYVGFAKIDTLKVENTGSGVLTVSNISSNNSVFSVSLTNFTVPAHDVQAVVVAFTPNDTGRFVGVLTIISNDSTQLKAPVPVAGNSLYPPLIGVSPDSLLFTVHEGDSATAAVNISNLGRGVLQFSVDINYQTTLQPVIALHRSSKADFIEQHQGNKFVWGENGSTADAVAGVSLPYRGLLSKVLSPPVIVRDSIGDGSRGVDIAEIRGQVSGGALTLQFVLATPLDPSNFGGYLGLDVDQNASTARALPYGKSEQDVGCEYIVSFFNLASNQVSLSDSSGTNLGTVSALVDSFSFTFTIQLSLLGNDNVQVNLAAVVGDISGPTDWIPDIGHGTVGGQWLFVTPTNGTVVSGGTTGLQVKILGDHFVGRTLTANIVVSSNDPAHGVVRIPVRLDVVTGVHEPDEGIPTEFTMHQNYPNPFNPSTTIKYGIPFASQVTLAIYNVLGEEISTFVEGQQPPGWHHLIWSADRMPSGLYFYRIIAVATNKNGRFFTETRKMLLLK